jgi:hypothetical protein
MWYIIWLASGAEPGMPGWAGFLTTRTNTKTIITTNIERPGARGQGPGATEPPELAAIAFWPATAAEPWTHTATIFAPTS